MTDTTDIKALRERLNDWLNSSTGYADLQKIAEDAIEQLEAERQRVAEITEQYVDRTTALSFASQRLQKAEKSNAFLKAELDQLANFNPDWDMLEACRESWREVVALLKERNVEIAALKAKLANPVVLPAGYSTRAGHPFHEGERNVMIPNKHGDWLSRFDVEHAIHVAGFQFTVEGE